MAKQTVNTKIYLLLIKTIGSVQRCAQIHWHYGAHLKGYCANDACTVERFWWGVSVALIQPIVSECWGFGNGTRNRTLAPTARRAAATHTTRPRLRISWVAESRSLSWGKSCICISSSWCDVLSAVQSSSGLKQRKYCPSILSQFDKIQVL